MEYPRRHDAQAPTSPSGPARIDLLRPRDRDRRRARGRARRRHHRTATSSPPNIFLTQRGHAKILDFGLAQVASLRSAAPSHGGGPTVTVDAPPDECRQRAGNGGVHVAGAGPGGSRWTRGRTCSRSGSCSTKWRPARCHFAGTARRSCFRPFSIDAPVPPARLNPDVPAELARIIDKCLEKNRDLRYQQASDIRTDLQRVKRDTDSGRVPAERSPPPPPSPVGR